MAKDKGQADEGESLVDYQARRQREAYEANALPPDPGQEFQRVTSKIGRESFQMPSKDIQDHARELAKQSGRPLSESGLVQEPVTEKTVSGHSDEKKAKLAKSKKSSRKGKGD